ncbi:MAG: 50S ribosomal protein L32 [SAR202 cluster bacterium]|nr:50S ribosomal protein L32 [SAR202 cluster bacterium]
MPPLPKKKQTKYRKGGRAAHMSLTKPSYGMCPEPNCNEPKQPYRACPTCGFYNGRQVIGNVEETSLDSV